MQNRPWEEYGGPAAASEPIVVRQADPVQRMSRQLDLEERQRRARLAPLNEDLVRLRVRQAQIATDRAAQAPAAAQNAAQVAAQRRQAAAGSLARQLDELEGVYNENFRGSGVGSILEYLPTNASARLNTIANAMRPTLKRLIRDPGEGTFTDQDQALLDSLVPDSWARDASNEERIRQLRAMIDEVGGGAPAAAPSHAAPSSAAEPTPTAQPRENMTALGPVVGDPGRGTAQTSTEVQRVTDQGLAAISPRLGAMITAGRPIGELLQYARDHGVNPAAIQGSLNSIYSQRANPNSSVARWIRANPGRPYPVDPTYERPLTAQERSDAAVSSSAPGAYLIGGANALTAGYLPELAGLTGGDTEQVRSSMETLRSEQPVPDFFGNVTGGALAMMGPGALASRSARLTQLLARAPRTAAVAGDLAYGAAYGSGMDPENRLRGAAEGAAVAVPAGIAGHAAIRGAGNLVGGTPQQPAVQRLIDQGFVLSPAQRAAGNETLLGATRRRLDDSLTSSPVLGDAISAQRTRQFEHLGRATVDEALAPVGATAPRNLQGNELIEFANQRVSDAYDRALPGIRAPLDPDFIAANNAVRASAANLPQAQREAFDTIYQRAVTPFIPANGELTGQALQDIKRGLDKQILRLDRTANPADEYLSDELRSLRTVFFDWAERAAPDRVADFRAANAAYANMVRVNRAAAAAKRDGIFTPDQLLGAIKANAGDSQFASGGLPMQQLGQDAQQILPSTVPDSGTAGRVLANTLGPATALGGTTVMPALSPLLAPYAAKTVQHLPGVDRLLQALATSRTAGLARRGQQLRSRARLGSAAAVPVAIESSAGNR